MESFCNLLTQMTVHLRLTHFAIAIKGPMSVAIDILPENFDQLVENFCSSELLQDKENLMIHLSLKQGVSINFFHLSMSRNITVPNGIF